MFEYLAVRFSSVHTMADLTDRLENYGRSGWEMVSAQWLDQISVTVIFKRRG